MKKLPVIRAAFLSSLIGLVTLSPLTGETFRYRFIDGDSYRINSVVNENVYVNRILTHQADITNRITVAVSDVKKGDPQATDKTKYASAKHDCTFMTSERNTNRAFTWGREYKSIFRRDELGNYDIGEEYFMPVVRNVPTFPEGDIKPGATWTGTGEEAHDLRDTFGIEKPFKVPFTVTYTYVGPVPEGRQDAASHQGRVHNVFRLAGTSSRGPQAGRRKAGKQPERTGRTGTITPRRPWGFSRQQIYWDNELGIIPYYTEEFRIRMELESGTELEFRGTAEATVTDIQADGSRQDRAGDEQGNFEARHRQHDGENRPTRASLSASRTSSSRADSANLMQSEKDKITKIAGILAKYPDKELLVSGHTALAGTASSRQKLSEERADAVAKFSSCSSACAANTTCTPRGFGAEKPLVPTRARKIGRATDASRSRFSTNSAFS